MKEASLVSDCLPEPPTPTSKALPRGVRITREIYKQTENIKNSHNTKQAENKNYAKCYFTFSNILMQEIHRSQMVYLTLETALLQLTCFQQKN